MARRCLVILQNFHHQINGFVGPASRLRHVSCSSSSRRQSSPAYCAALQLCSLVPGRQTQAQRHRSGGNSIAREQSGTSLRSSQYDWLKQETRRSMTKSAKTQLLYLLLGLFIIASMTYYVMDVLALYQRVFMRPVMRKGRSAWTTTALTLRR